MPADNAQIIHEPFNELMAERKKHLETLNTLELFVERARIRNAHGVVSDKFCKLCDKVPAGVDPAKYRASCPCKSAPAVVGNQRSRLRQRIKQNAAPSFE